MSVEVGLPRSGNHAMAQTVTRKKKSQKLNPTVLKGIIRRIVAVATPEKIILFGSAARGEMGPNSDVDLLVIKRGRFNRAKVTTDIYRHMHGAGQAVDIIVVTPEEVERYRDTHCLVICPAQPVRGQRRWRKRSATKANP